MSAIDAAVQVFDSWRTARLNRRYYELRLAHQRQVVTRLDVVTLAATAVVGAGIWFTAASESVLFITRLVSIVATGCAGYQLLKKPGECAATLEAHVAIYEQLDANLERLVRRIKAGDYNETILDDMDIALDALHSVRLSRVEAVVRKDLLNKAFGEVKKEIPADYFRQGG